MKPARTLLPRNCTASIARRPTRRRFVRGIAAASLSLAGLGALAGCEKKQSAKQRRIGFLTAGAPDLIRYPDAFRRGLRDHGYVEGQNLVVEWRYGEGAAERLPELAAELVRLPVEIIIADHAPAIRAAAAATSTIPIVMASGGNPVANGLVASLAQPGGNVTGLATLSPELSAKRMQLFKETFPWITRAAVLWNPSLPEKRVEFDETVTAARSLGVQTISLEAHHLDDVDAAIRLALREQADSFITLWGPMGGVVRDNMHEALRINRWPSMCEGRGFVMEGGMMSYGADQEDLHHRAARYVDRILKGAKPSELPVEQPTRFDFTLNMKLVQEFGVTIPPAVLAQVTEAVQ